MAGVPQATCTALAAVNGATDPAADAAYALLAANDLRNDIAQVPGSGPVRGVAVYNDRVYAFRDNAAGNAGLMYVASTSGWQPVSFGTEIQFSSSLGGSTPSAVGATIGNAAVPSKTATVLAVLTRTGIWGSNAVGTLIVTPNVGSFAQGDAIFVGAVQQAVCASAATPIGRNAGGRVETVVASFNSASGNRKLYGADGVNLAFEFDCQNYLPIRTGMPNDTPSHLMVHKFYLFLSFNGSVQFSGIANPYAWTVVLGAGEIAVGDTVTGFVPQGGSSSGSSLAIFTKGKTDVLYGSSPADFNLVASIYEQGYAAGTMQAVSNNTYGLTSRGIQALVTTLTYGDFDFASVSHNVTEFLRARQGLETCSTSLKAKNQYRLYFSDGYALQLGLDGDKVSGLMPLNYGRAVRCMTTANLSNGSEVTYFGSDDGYVYRDNVGTSYDGAPIEAWIRLPFNHSRSPQVRKRYRRAVIEVKATGYARMNVSYDLGYASPYVNPAAPRAPTTMRGAWPVSVRSRFRLDSSAPAPSAALADSSSACW